MNPYNCESDKIMNKKQYSILISAAMLVGSGWADEVKKPNLILIMADDLGYGHFAANMSDYTIDELNPEFFERDRQLKIPPYDAELAVEYARLSTIQLDRLAKQGVRMTEAHVAMSLCAPSRSALMTARYPQRYGGYSNWDVERSGLPDGETTLVPALKAAGYTNGMIGKWHLQSMENPEHEDNKWQHPFRQGFDYYMGYNSSTTRYIEPSHWYRGYENVPPKEIPYTTDVITEEALAFVEKNAEGPFFLYLCHNAPHGPYNERPPEKYMSEFNSGDERMDIYNGIVKAMDVGIGRLMDKLEELNIADNTVVVFLSDNGPGGSRWTVLPGAGAFRGMKGHLWQGGLRVPMVVRWPARLKGGTEYHGLISAMDIMPTFLKLANAQPPEGVELDGRDFMPVLTGQSTEPIHEHLFFAGQHSDFWGLKGYWSLGNHIPENRGLGKDVPDNRSKDPSGWAVRQGDYMLRYWGEPNRLELYNVKDDKGEKVNILSPEHAARVAAMKQAYREWFTRVREPNVYSREQWKKLIPDGMKR